MRATVGACAFLDWVLSLQPRIPAARSLAWALHGLSTHPAVQTALHAELDGVLGPPSKAQRHVTSDDVSKLPYLSAVVNESMRLWPVAADGVFRIAPCDTVLPGGWFIRKGEVVRCGGYAAHTGAGFEGAFDKPRDFLPERWLPGAQQPTPEGFLPFAFGPRGCAGQTLAALQSACRAVNVARVPTTADASFSARGARPACARVRLHRSQGRRQCYLQNGAHAGACRRTAAHRHAARVNHGIGAEMYGSFASFSHLPRVGRRWWFTSSGASSPPTRLGHAC